tara:strand:- start:526 stop:903 length:378 start_codon:yes stop_codon:yes gene_type:complete
MVSKQTPLGSVRGLGSAKDGTQHWLLQRLTAVALVPLLLWFISGLLCVTDYSSALAWVASPYSTVLFIALLLTSFYHAQLGLQVVIEDYIHVDWIKFCSLFMVKVVVFLATLMGIIAVLKISLGS